MMNNKSRKNTSSSPPKSGPVTIKISKNVLFLILGVCIMNFVVSFLSLSIALFSPLKINKNITTVEKKLSELIMLWQAGDLGSSNTGNSQVSDKTQDTTTSSKVPSLTEPYIQEELEIISKSIQETVKSATVLPEAMLELDASGLNVKGDTSHIQIKSVSSAEQILSNIKNESRYINKIFFGTKGDNFVVVPGAKASDEYMPTQEQWYKLATSNIDQVKWSQIKQDEFSKEYIITGSMAVKSKERILGVIGVQVSLSKMK